MNELALIEPNDHHEVNLIEADELAAFEGELWFAQLTDENRIGIRAKLAAIARLRAARRGTKGRVEKQEAALMSMAPSTLRGWVTQFEKHHDDPQSLIDWRYEKHEDAIMPLPFREFWKSLCEENQRSDSAAHRKMCQLYWSRATSYKWVETSDVVDLWPGYDVRPDPSPFSREGLPRGWSLSNLRRPGNGLTKAEKLAARQGPAAASAQLEQVFTTRVGLKVGQYYVFDDRWLDVLAVLMGVSRKPVRCVELSCGDILSGSTVAWGLLPMIENEAGKQQRLKDRDMRFLLARVLCLIGYHQDGVTLMVEHGTAAISQALEFYLCVASGGEVGVVEVVRNGKTIRERQIIREGKIRVRRSGIQGGTAFAGGFATKGEGNFRFKASAESLHNMKHNELADLPGQVGKNSRLETVETNHGRDAEARYILTAITEMRPSMAEKIATGYMSSAELFWANDRAIERIDGYTDHHLQGWVEAGFVTEEFRVAPTSLDWRPMSELLTYSPARRAATEAMIREEHWATRTRQLCRREVWNNGRHELTKLPLHNVQEILGPENAMKKPDGSDYTVLHNGTFTFSKKGEDDRIYRAIIQREDGTKQILTPGAAYRTFEIEVGTLVVYHTSGGYLGTCKMLERTERDDTEAFVRAAGEAEATSAAVMSPFYKRAVARAKAETNRKRQNAAVVEMAATVADDTEITDQEPKLYGSVSNT